LQQEFKIVIVDSIFYFVAMDTRHPFLHVSVPSSYGNLKRTGLHHWNTLFHPRVFFFRCCFAKYVLQRHY